MAPSQDWHQPRNRTGSAASGFRLNTIFSPSGASLAQAAAPPPGQQKFRPAQDRGVVLVVVNRGIAPPGVQQRRAISTAPLAAVTCRGRCNCSPTARAWHASAPCAISPRTAASFFLVADRCRAMVSRPCRPTRKGSSRSIASARSWRPRPSGAAMKSSSAPAACSIEAIVGSACSVAGCRQRRAPVASGVWIAPHVEQEPHDSAGLFAAAWCSGVRSCSLRLIRALRSDGSRVTKFRTSSARPRAIADQRSSLAP